MSSVLRRAREGARALARAGFAPPRAHVSRLARAPPVSAGPPRAPPTLRRSLARSAGVPAAAAAAAAHEADDRDLLQSIVKVFTVHSSPNYFMPWQNKPQRESSGSGVVVSVPSVPGGVGILTNAHVVADQTFVQVRRHGSSVKHRARVHAIGHECDLAVLVVDDPGFWAPRANPLPLGPVPNLQAHVAVIGFPQGGDNLSITSGVVSRVELTNYAHGAARLLAVQLDAAINPGNSGGPAVQDGAVVGLAFQNLANSDNIGYVIPTPIVARFLDDVAARTETGDNEAAVAPTSAMEERDPNPNPNDPNSNPKTPASGVVSHAGFCALGVKCQATDNPALRRYLGMRGDETGVLVTDVLKLGASAGVLRKDDVLLAVDGCAVANDGTVRFRGWERVAFDHVVSLKTPGEAATLTVRRRKQRIREEGARASAEEETKEDPEGVGFRSSDSDSELLELVVHVHPRASLVPVHQYDRLPSFYVYAGLVFSPLTQPHLHEFGDDWFNVAPRALVDRALNHHPKRRGEQVVILSQVLADEINAGYQGMHDVEVRRVNGREVRNLAALAEAVEAGRGDAFLRVDFADDRVLVVGRREAEEAHERIMAKHRVPMRMSADLMNVRGGGGGGEWRGEKRGEASGRGEASRRVN